MLDQRSNRPTKLGPSFKVFLAFFLAPIVFDVFLLGLIAVDIQSLGDGTWILPISILLGAASSGFCAWWIGSKVLHRGMVVTILVTFLSLAALLATYAFLWFMGCVFVLGNL